MPSNAEIVRRAFELHGRGDSAGVLALYDPDVIWDTTRDTLLDNPSSPNPFTTLAVYRGHDGLRAFFREWYDSWTHVVDTCEELVEVGDRVVTVVSSTARGRASGIPVEYRHAAVWAFRGGKITGVTWYSTREEALKAAGIGE